MVSDHDQSEALSSSVPPSCLTPSGRHIRYLLYEPWTSYATIANGWTVYDDQESSTRDVPIFSLSTSCDRFRFLDGRNRVGMKCLRIPRLPADILIQIFESLKRISPPRKPLKDRRPDGTTYLGWLSVMHVCSSWREVRRRFLRNEHSLLTSLTRSLVNIHPCGRTYLATYSLLNGSG